MIDESSGRPAERYAQALASGQFSPDTAQAQAVQALDTLWGQLMDSYELSRRKGFRLFTSRATPRGLYLWGGVGRGKTWLMDQFFDAIPFRRKLRMHFHHFMQRVHRELHALTGQRDPLDTVADQIHQEAVVIGFDEFFVSSVSDAMILGDLFTKLFARGITLVATSNIAPDGLYQNGIQRDRFLPAIAELNRHCQVLNVDSGVDYRLRVLRQADLYRSPLTSDNERWLAQRFDDLTRGQTLSDEPIMVNQRQIDSRGHTEDVIWFDFAELCMKPRSAADFIEIARTYGTVLVGRVPLLNDQISDPVRRFIYLVDEFYDRRVKLIVNAEEPILSLYGGEKLLFEIQRTRSRLLEMQSDDYLHDAHRIAHDKVTLTRL